MAHDGEYSVSGPAAFSLRNAFGPGHDSGEGKQPGKHHAPVLRLSDGHHHIRGAAQRGLEEGWESQKELICTQAEEYLESRALDQGISCRAVVEGEIDEEGVFSVKKAEILPAASRSAREKETLRRLAEESLGLAGEQVIIGEGEGHGEEMDDAGIYPEGL